MITDLPTTVAQVPEIVAIVLRQAAQWRLAGEIEDSEFEMKLERLREKELRPRRLELEVTALRQGQIQFTITHEPSDRVWAIVNCQAETVER